MTLLNEADAVFIGTLEADRIYLGTTLVWEPEVAGPPVTAGLAVWHDASQLALADGANVTAWPNLGSGNQATILGTPTYKTNAANGKGVVRFVGATGLRGANTQYASIGSGDGMKFTYTMLYVSRRWGGGTGRLFTAPYPEGGNHLVGYHTGTLECCHDDGGWLWTGIGYSPTPPDPWKLLGTDNQVGVGVRYFIDGVFKVGAGTQGNLAYYYNLNGYQLTAASTETGDFDVAELIIYDRKLPDAERIQVENYLRTKWGL